MSDPQNTRTSLDFKATNPKDKAATDRIDLTLFPDTATVYGALAFTEGDCKYGAYNFREGGVLASTYVAALRRHVAKWYNGSDIDPKTLVPHLANAIGCLAVLIDAIEGGFLKDDRPPKVDMEGLIDRVRGNVTHLQTMFPNGPERFKEKKY